MSTIDLSAPQKPLIRPLSARAHASQSGTPATQEMDSGDFYIGSTKISALPQHNAVQANRLSSAK